MRADEPVSIGDDLWRGGFAGADGTDRFVGDYDSCELLIRKSGNTAPKLRRQYHFRVLFFAFSDANDRGESGIERRQGLFFNTLSLVSPK